MARPRGRTIPSREPGYAVAGSLALCALLLVPVGARSWSFGHSPDEVYGHDRFLRGAQNGTNLVVPSIGLNGTDVLYDPQDGKLYIASPSNGTLLVANASTHQLVSPPIPVGTDQVAMAVDSNNRCLYIVETGLAQWSSVVVVNLTTDQVVPTHIMTGANSEAIAFDPRNGFLYVSNTASNNVTVINGSSNEATGPAIFLLGPRALAYDSRTGDLYVGGGDWEDQGGGVVNTTTNTVYGNVSGAAGTWGLAYDPANSQLYGDFQSGQGIVVINDSTRNVSSFIRDRASGPFGVLVEGNSGRIVFGHQVFDAATNSFPYPFLMSGFGVTAYDPSTGWTFGPYSNPGTGPSPLILAIRDTELVNVDFIETGLAKGTLWTVETGADYWDQAPGADYITSVGNHSYNRTIGLALWNGTYSYDVTAAAAPPGPAPSGSVVVDGPGSSASVLFGPFQYAVTIRESGLSAGTEWSVSISGGPPGSAVGGTSANGSIGFELGNGSYSLKAETIGFPAAVVAFPLLVDGSSVNETVLFFPPPSSRPLISIPSTADLALGVGIVGLGIGVVAIILLLRLRRLPPNSGPPSR